jgi:UDP-N-acetylglucosamine 2-epimerase (non-hydrolysing)
MLKVLSVFGTRPEAIKMAPLIRAMTARESDFISQVCITAQHRQMLDQVLNLFRIVPDYDLDVMEENQSPTRVSAAVLSRLEPVLQQVSPDWVLVQGDTTSTAAAALAAFHAGAKVAHVEAGLRTGDKWQPFPEEMNRRMVTLIADLHFAPTEQSRQNLLREGVRRECILVTGNPGIDALHWALRQPPPAGLAALLQRGEHQKLIVVTAHRRENFGQPLENVCTALRAVAAGYRDKARIIFLVHPNPRVGDLARRMLSDVHGITLLAPLDYVSMAHLLRQAHLIVTDSGGLQEEATSLGKPILVIRKVTDRPESVAAGTARVVGVESETITHHLVKLLEDEAAYRASAQAESVYGDGQASGKIIDSLLSFQ